MTQKLNYLILEDHHLILEYYRGKYNVDELIAFKKRVASDKDYNPNYDIIHDFRDMEFLLSPKDVAKYVELLNQDSKYVGSRKSTMLTATPNQVVASTAFDLQKNDLPIEVNVCSTLEAALTFIEAPAEIHNTIARLFEQLK